MVKRIYCIDVLQSFMTKHFCREKRFLSGGAEIKICVQSLNT